MSFWGAANPDLEARAGEPLAVALCPVRTAARHVLHTLDLRHRQGKDTEPFPLLPDIQGQTAPNSAVAGTAKGRNMFKHYRERAMSMYIIQRVRYP